MAEMDSEWAYPLASRGYLVGNVEYRSAEDAAAPAAILDVRSAAAWFCQHAVDLGFDASRLAILGASAGGHLALMAALPPILDDELGASCKPAAVVSLWGITDLGDLVDGPNAREFAGRWVPSSQRQPETLARWSPTFWASIDSPPVLMVHARGDSVVPFAQAERLGSLLGPKAELRAFDREWHSPPAADYPVVFGHVIDFLERTL